MTWSIVARDTHGALGVAVASRFFAVGALCPYARSGVGALATQALVNPGYGIAGLDRLVQGDSPRQVIEALVGDDDGREHRQVHLIDAAGRTAAYTGAQCIGWCGDLAADGFSVAGNMLAGERVIGDTAEAFRHHAHLALAERLLLALEAGEAAGGDKRGKQAAALRIVTTEDYPMLDLRVDDHVEPLAELRRLYDVSLERFQAFVTCLPTRARPAGITDRATIEREIERFRASRAATMHDATRGR
ncbi:MAG TPA: DUF1028 domain-containing protein [Casimicrobiaceae bacterium]|nr:DUF1028 domain-containing protein [Casimicrobiaceae bacterium]